jgi:signal peptidase II
MNRRNIIFSVIVVVGILFDQWTKLWVINNIRGPRQLGSILPRELPIIPDWLSLVHVKNPGAAMGMLQTFEYRQHLFAVFTVIALVIILDLFRKLPKDDWFLSTTMGLILSGAIGNAIDRVRFQEVTDFVKVYTEVPWQKSWLINTFGTNEWPSFNVADSALMVGAFLFLIHYLFLEEDEASGETTPVSDTSPEQITAEE